MMFKGLISIMLVCLVGISLQNQDCEFLGFHSSLTCDKCSLMKEYIPNEGIIKQCQQCCHEDNTMEEGEKYTKIELWISKREYNHLKPIRKMIKDIQASNRFPNFQVKFSDYYRITLVLYKNEKPVSRLNIENWSPETIEEFLQSKLA